jgi:hypothetical protein
MSTSIRSTFVAVTSSARQFGAAIAVDLWTRSMGNAAHVWKRITGADITGFATNSVAGHGHAGGGDGLPMPRHIASMTSATPTIGVTPTEADYAGYLSPASEPLISFYPGNEEADPTELLQPTGRVPILSVPGTTRSNGVRIAPCFRRVLISPGCTRVGARLTFNRIGLEQVNLAPAVSLWSVNLSSAPSSSVTGDVTGLTGATYTAAQRGAAQPLSIAIEPTPRLSFDASEGLFYLEEGALNPREVWLGRPIKPRRDRGGDVAPTRAVIGGSPGDYVANPRDGAVAVTPGAYNDIDIEVVWTDQNSVLFIYSIDLFELPG